MQLLFVKLTAVLIACYCTAEAHTIRKRQATVQGSAGTAANANGPTNQTQTASDLQNNIDSNGNGEINANTGGTASGTGKSDVTSTNELLIVNPSGTITYTGGSGGMVATGSQGSAAQMALATLIRNGGLQLLSRKFGTASGPGDSSVTSGGSAVVVVGSQMPAHSVTSEAQNVRASGSLTSSVAGSSDQTMNATHYDNTLMGSAVGQGVNSATAQSEMTQTKATGEVVKNNLLVSGTGGTSVDTAANGYVSESNTGGLNVNSGQATGLATGGNTTLNSMIDVGNSASSLQLSGSGGVVVENGTSTITANQQALQNAANALSGNGVGDAEADGSGQQVSIVGGLSAHDSGVGKDTTAMGQATVNADGNRPSNSVVGVDTSYAADGTTVVELNGNAISNCVNDPNCELKLDGYSMLQETGGTTTSQQILAESEGTAVGDGDTTIEGQMFTHTDSNNGGYGTVGNSARSSGANAANSSSTSTLTVDDILGGQRTSTANANAGATGADSTAHSMTQVTDVAGIQTVFQNTNATGASSSSVSIGRKKRQAGEQQPAIATGPAADVQRLEVMRICVGDKAAGSDCPLFIKVRDASTGASRWRHMNLMEFLKLLYGRDLELHKTNGPQRTVTTAYTNSNRDLVLVLS